MSSPEVSVVIPTRNRLELLRDAVRSIQEQSWRDWELIVVDDASEDGTQAWLAGVDDCRLRILRSERRQERCAARNRGLGAARSESVLFLDDDDRLRPKALERLLKQLHGRDDAMAAVGNVVAFDGRGHRRRESQIWLPFTKTVWGEVLLGWVAFQGQCLLRTRAIRRCGGWDEALSASEDHELWLRLGELGPVTFVPGTVLERRVHRGQARSENGQAVEDGCFNRYVATLSGATRQKAERLLEARALRRTAAEAYAAGRFPEVVTALSGAIRLAPMLLRSPVLGSDTAMVLVKAFAGSVLGRPATRALRRLVVNARRRLGRDPQPLA